MLSEYIADHGEEYKREIEIKNLHGSPSEREEIIKDADIIIGFIPELIAQADKGLFEQVTNISQRFPMAKTINKKGFGDPLGYFQPFAIVPFVIFYNPELTNELEIPRCWDDLLDVKWKGRILMPAKEHMAPKVIRGILKHQNPEKIHRVDENIICKGMPPNVIQAVKDGEFALGITNITFGKISTNQKIKIISLEDGFLCMPQSIAWKKGVNDNTLRLGDFLLSSKVQNFLVQQGFISVNNEDEPSETTKISIQSIKWPGWQHFRGAMEDIV